MTYVVFILYITQTFKLTIFDDFKIILERGNLL